MVSVVLSLLSGLAELLLPSVCAACGRLSGEERPLCETCAMALDPIAHPCPRCAVPLPRGDPSARCLACATRPPPWAAAAVPYIYGGELATAIRRWKIAGRPERTRPLARLLAPSVARLPPSVTALVPVPLHPRRLAARQFNQASLLVRMARGPNAPTVREWLDRVRDTPSQSTLDARSRRRNVRGAFAVPRSARAEVRGAHLVLVDDVLTTGATATACARALLAGGAARVDLLVLARAVPD